VELEISCFIENDFYKLRIITLIYLKRDNCGVGHCSPTKAIEAKVVCQVERPPTEAGLAFEIGIGRIIPPLEFNGGMTRGSGR
jgi:hypothetical protein